MGKSTKPTKWFKAVKKAFRSPSKEKPSPGSQGGDADENLLKRPGFPPAAAPHLFPSYQGAPPTESPPQQRHGPSLREALLATAGAAMEDKKLKEWEEPELQQQQHSRNGNGHGVGKRQDDENRERTQREGDEGATRIQQRFLRSSLALKGLIRLQALARGQLVRRQAATTLRTMEAIVRVQALFRGRQVRLSKDGRAVKTRISRIQQLCSQVQGDARREEFQEMEPETSDFEHEANKRKRRTAYLLTQQLKRSTPNRSSSFIDCDPDQPHEGWAWLELWTNAKAWESRQLEAAAAAAAAHESKLDPRDYIEIIPGNSRRTSNYPAIKEVDFHTVSKVKYHENGNGSSHSDPVAAMDGKSTAGESEGGLFSPKKSTSPRWTNPSPAASEDAAVSPDGIPPSPNPSEASVTLDSAAEVEDPSLAMEQLLLPEAANGSTTPSDSFSTSNGVDGQPACLGVEDAAKAEAPASEIENGGLPEDASFFHQENGDETQTRKEESPVGSKRVPCRYMAATESTKAKFRSSSTPKTRGSTTEGPESPAAATPPKQRNSFAGVTGAQGIGSKGPGQSPGKTPVAFGTRKTTTRRSPSPKTGAPKEKPRSVDAGHGGVSPARRTSLGPGDDKRWRT